jgi:endonuclease/exonuclease/phosphatase (EEP) superfamily protein YafD
MTRRRRHLLLLAAWMTGAALAIGLIGQAGRVSARADVVNFLAPVWLAAGLFAALLLLIAGTTRRARWAACGALMALGLMALSLRPVALHSEAECPGAALSLVQFNVLNDNADIRPAVAWIEGTDADVVTLEEAAAELPVIRMLSARYPYAVSCAPAMRCSTVILSRTPFLASGGLAQGDAENRKALSAAWATLATPSGPFTIVAAHLDRPWPWHSRKEDLTQLAGFVRGQGDETTLVSGDFNLPAWSFQLQHMTDALGLARAPDIRSWPATSVLPALVAIDHILFGKRWRLDHIGRGPALGSDHYPLFARMRLLPVDSRCR